MRCSPWAGRLALRLLSLLLLASPASGDEPYRLGQLLGFPDSVQLSLQHRTRYEFLDAQFVNGFTGPADALSLRTLVHLRLRPREGLVVGAELQDSRAVLTEPSGPSLTTGIVNAAELLQAYVELERPELAGGRLLLRAGRITLNVGSRRLVARNRFRNTINGFTGIDLAWQASESAWGLRAIGTFPQRRLPTGAMTLLSNPVQFDLESAQFAFWGLHGFRQLPADMVGELYVFGLHDDASGRQLYSPGIRIDRPPGEGRFDWEFESVLQAGRSRLPQTGMGAVDLSHLAHFQHLELGYTFDVRFSPRLVAQWDFASGDGDATDGSSERFDTLFGARRGEFGPTGILGPFARSNLNTPGIRLQLEPHEHVDAFVSYRGFWLASAFDAWVGSGFPADPTGSAGSYLGSQLEFRIGWNLMPGNLRLELGYAHLFAGDVIRSRIPGYPGTNYFYSQLAIAF